MKQIYFDNNATAEMLTEVRDAMLPLIGGAYNASSVHGIGRATKALIEVARGNILAAIGAAKAKYNLVFTASATEANNLLIDNFADSHIFISAIEHPSIDRPAADKALVTKIKVDADGLLDLTHLEQELARSKAGKKLVSIICANNETGVIQDVSAILKLTRHYNAIFHTDAVQAFGRIEINIKNLDIDLLTISGHKCGGPAGVGVLIYKRDLKLLPQILGGGQELGLRSGTENVTAIVGMGKLAELLPQVVNRYARIRTLRDSLEDAISDIAPIKIFGKEVVRLPNTSCITMPHINNDVQMINFDLSGFAISAGSACSSGKIETSSVLLAMGVDENEAKCAIRISLGLSNTDKEIKEFVTTWRTIYSRLSDGFNEQDQLVQRGFLQQPDNNNNYIH